MGHDSTLPFLTFHALRIKGLATTAAIAEMTTLDEPTVEVHLQRLLERGFAKYREPRQLWQVTPDGHVAHEEQLAADLAGADVGDIGRPYAEFLGLNGEFKALCGQWQLRDGRPNAHDDEEYDLGVVAALRRLHDRVAPNLEALERALTRLGPYAPRLAAALDRLEEGETSAFTGVMCGSYHDIWMELHEDLLLTQRIDRWAEGSF